MSSISGKQQSRPWRKHYQKELSFESRFDKVLRFFFGRSDIDVSIVVLLICLITGTIWLNWSSGYEIQKNMMPGHLKLWSQFCRHHSYCKFYRHEKQTKMSRASVKCVPNSPRRRSDIYTNVLIVHILSGKLSYF